MKEKKDFKYLIKSNNYVGLLFFALVLASLLYIIKRETPEFKDIEPSSNKIIVPVESTKEFTTETDEIIELRKYLNLGDSKTFNIYQSNYIYNEKITTSNIDTETMLYMAYKYIEKTTNFTEHTKYITCEEAKKVQLDTQLIQCGGYKLSSTHYTVNTYITKELLNKTIQKLFNKSISDYTNFYTNEDSLCYFVENEYICVSHKNENEEETEAETEFVKASKTSDKIEIYEKYRYIVDGIYYKGFKSNEVGEGYFKSTFIKRNGTYYWDSTEYIESN